MAQATLVLGTPTHQNTGSWVQWDERDTGYGSLTAFASPAGAARVLVRLRIWRQPPQIQFQTVAFPDGSSGFSTHEELSAAWESSNSAVTVQVAGLDDLVITGPNSTSSVSTDTTEPYAWTQGNSDKQATWFDAYEKAGRPSVTIIVSDVQSVSHAVDADNVAWTVETPQPTVTRTRQPQSHAVDAGNVAWAVETPQPTVAHTPPQSHAVDAGPAAWEFAVPQPAITSSGLPTKSHAVDAGAVNWAFAVPEPSIGGRVESTIGEYRVSIAGVDTGPEWVQKNTVRIERTLRQRAQLSFQMDIPLADVPAAWFRGKPPPYSLVEVWWVTRPLGIAHKRFTGIIYQSPMTVEPDGSGQHWLHLDVQAPSLAARLDNRIIEGYERTVSGETVAQTIVRMMNKYAVGEGISTAGVIGGDITEPDVYDYITITEMINRLADQSNSVWDVSPDAPAPFLGVLKFAPRGVLEVEPYTLTLQNVESITIEDDIQRHRTRQTIIGSLPDAGQYKQFFNGDGVKREFILDFRIDQIVEVSLGGASQEFGSETDGYPWIVDPSRSTLRVRTGNPVPPVGVQNLAVLFDYRGPVLASKSDAVAVAAYGIIHNVIQDSAVETVQEAETLLSRELNRHSSPNVNMNIRVLFDEIPEMQVGNLVPVNMPELGIHAERWLLPTTVESSEGDGLIYDATLVAEDYEELGQDYFRRQQKLTTPTGGRPVQAIPTGGLVATLETFTVDFATGYMLGDTEMHVDGRTGVESLLPGEYFRVAGSTVDHLIESGGSDSLSEFDVTFSPGLAIFVADDVVITKYAPSGATIDPNVLLHQGLRLPKPLGGYDFSTTSEATWQDIPGAILVPLDGLRLPDARIEYSFNAYVKGLTGANMGHVRLYNETDSTQQGGVVNVTATIPTPYIMGRVTLVGKIARYKLQARCTTAAGRRKGIVVWGGTIDVGT